LYIRCTIKFNVLNKKAEGLLASMIAHSVAPHKRQNGLSSLLLCLLAV
jgi:hypothetical protein